MTQPTANPTNAPPALHRFLPLLLALFVGSGCAALIYEIVWFQLLQLVIGSSAVSLGVLLGTFMGGMCLGSLALPRLISPRRHPLRVYALLELGIGIVGVGVLFGMPLIDRFYAAYVGQGLRGILLRGVVCGVCLLPPTVLMGATLPAIARWIETTPRGVAWLGFFYGGNIAGAVFGCLLAGFYLLRVHDMATATYVAATINASVALIALGFAAQAPYRASLVERTQGSAARTTGSWAVYVAIALSGMSALGAEVIWTRLLSLLLGSTVYTFSIILAVFLVGLGIGSGIGSLLGREIARPRVALGVCQMLLAAAIAWTACMLARSLPYWPINPSLSTSPWYNFQMDLMRCVWAILPAAIFWGASFPLALASVAAPGRDPGRLVGGVYAANTVGAIAGALGFSLFLIVWAGHQQAQRALIGLSAAAALLAFAPYWWPRRAGVETRGAASRLAHDAWAAALLALSLAVALLLAWSVGNVPWGLIAYGRYWATWQREAMNVLYVGEGMNASVAVTELPSGVRNFHVSGKVEASSDRWDMRLQRMLGHIPALLHPKPRSVLIVGCGAGVTAGSFVLHPGVEEIVICEIEPLIPKVVARYFDAENYDLLNDPRVEVVYDDARHYILTTRRKFDVITSDPIHPWVKGAATLYTKEYFDLCRRHLKPGGVITQWVPLYESNADAVKSELATFFAVFPGGLIWSNDVHGEGYDVVLMGQETAAPINVDELIQRLDGREYDWVAESLYDVGFDSVMDLLATYAGQDADLKSWLADAQINRDRNLRLQYLAGLGLHAYESKNIFEEIVARRKFPENLFVASDQWKESFRRAMEKAK